MKDMAELFIEPSETATALLGANYMQNYLTGGGLTKGYGILTNKRFYYKGKNFSGKGKEATSTTTEGVVSLDDITYTQLDHTRHIGLLIFAILLAVVSVPFMFTEDSETIAIGFIGFMAAVAFAVTFFVKRQTLFTICFAGGRFGFDVRYYPIADIRDFQRQLHLLKDQRKNG